MKKSVYSLVLMDDVVAAIDELAYNLHTSRSNLINQILAEKVAMVTPKQHVQTIFDSLSDYLSTYTHFQIQEQADDHMYSIKSALKYKYNPTIRYCVYLGQQNGQLTGQLRLISRTQSEVLYYYLDHFVAMWSAIENEVSPALWQREEGTKWLRKLSLDAFQSPEQGDSLANTLSQYIKILDDGLKLYFSQLDDESAQQCQLKKHYFKNCQLADHLI